MRRLIYLFTVATLTVGCASSRPANSPTAADAQTIKQQADAAIADADAAIAKSRQMAQLTAGIDSRVPGQPRLSDAEMYRRTAISTRAKAHRYANLSNKCSFLAANVEDQSEKEYWRRYATDLATKSNGLRELAERYAERAKNVPRS